MLNERDMDQGKLIPRKITKPFVSVALVAATLAACTKKSANNSPAPAVLPTLATTSTPTSGLPGSGTVENLFRYSLSSVAGEMVFCQDFVSQSQTPLADLEKVTESMALAQAQIPVGVANPFSPKTLGLAVKPDACGNIPGVIKDGHCAISIGQDTASGKVTYRTEQRLLWKDLPILAQASYIKATLDQKTSAIDSKNELFRSVQRQITQQQQFLQILQLGQQVTTGQQSEMIKQAQELLTNLQNQAKQLEADVRALEAEVVPIQDELGKTLAKLETARTDLKQACTAAGMGAASAEWKAN
ncbi:MAG: hypothetical protein ACO3A4_07855 [Silvanigrellaceae bacterium]